ncbi:hypothetical protein IW145_003381 [Coemansia sp. RSA 521]|nr:hypothetical protein IW145_003381 [Coemansia sp. RSA 521]
MGKINVATLKEVCGEIVRNGDLDSLTDRVVRRSAEEKMGLESKALDVPPYKQLVKDTVAEVLAELTKEQESASGAAESGEDEASDKGESDGSEEDENNKNDSEDEDNGKGDSDNEDDEFSDVVDKEPAPSRPKKRESTSTSPQLTKRAKTTPAKPSSGNDTTITNLKSYIAKCGLRKVWAKELTGMNSAQQIRHLKAILDGLGMTGRPTLEKCKKIKAKRDLQAELEEMHVDNIISKEPEAGVARSRRGARVVAYNDHVSDSEDEEGEEEAGRAEEEAGGDEEEQSEESEQEESDVYTEAESDSGEDDDTKMNADGSDDDAGSA